MNRLEGWVIVRCGAQAYIGRRSGAEDAPALSPVFDLQSGVQLRETPQGPAVGRPCVAVPVLGFASIKSLPVPPFAIIIAVEDLDSDEREALARAVEIGAQIQGSMRAASSGITLAPADTKLPPMRRQ